MLANLANQKPQQFIGRFSRIWMFCLLLRWGSAKRSNISGRNGANRPIAPFWVRPAA